MSEFDCGVKASPESFAQVVDRLQFELAAVREENNSLLRRCQELQAANEELKERVRNTDEFVEQLKVSRDGFREENVILRSQLDIVYLIFGDRRRRD